MGDAEQLWVTAVPSYGPEEMGVLVGVDGQATDPGQRMVSAVLDSAHEGPDGVFFVLPSDLRARVAYRGDRLSVQLLTGAAAARRERERRTVDFRATVSGLGPGADDDGDDAPVMLLQRETTTDVAPPTDPGGGPQAVLIVHTEGRPPLGEILAAGRAGRVAFVAVRADPMV